MNIVSMQFTEFSHTERTCVTSTRSKKQDVTRTHRYPCASPSSHYPSPRVTTDWVPSSTAVSGLFYAVYSWDHTVHILLCLVSSLQYNIHEIRHCSFSFPCGTLSVDIRTTFLHVAARQLAMSGWGPSGLSLLGRRHAPTAQGLCRRRGC